MAYNTHDIILKNTTGATITIDDLSGIQISASSQVDVTKLFPFDRLAKSEDLEGYISSNDIVFNVNSFDVDINTALSYLNTKDATSIQGIPVGTTGSGVTATLSGGYVLEYDGDEIQLKFKPYEFKSLRDVNINPDGTYTIDDAEGNTPVPEMSFLDLTDTPTTYSGADEWAVTVTHSGTLNFSPAVSATIIQSATPPDPEDANLWYSTTDNDIFYYDTARNVWLTTTAHNYVFSRSGAVGGAYLAIDAVVDSSAHYWIPKDAILTGVIINSQETLNDSKTYYIRDWTTTLTGGLFTCTDYVYQAFDINVPVDSGTRMRCYVDNAGQSVKNCIVIFEIRWRYDVV